MSDLAGTTRDAVSSGWIYNGRRLVLVDTAGLDQKQRRRDRIDDLSKEQVQRVINYSHVVLIIIDCEKAITQEDLQIIEEVIDEGRSVVLIGNKWDMVNDKFKKKAKTYMEKQVEKYIGIAKGLPITFISAKTGYRIDKVMDEVLRVYEKWNTRVSTNLTNRWAREFQVV